MTSTLRAIAASTALATALLGIAALPAAAERGPLTLDQCSGETLDRQMTYDTVPQKVFTTDPQSAEFLIAMGLGDRIVGTWDTYPEDVQATIPEYAEQLAAIPVLGDGQTWPPTLESIAASGADLVLSTYRLNMPGYLDATRLFDDLGVPSYSFTTYCTGGVLRDFDPLFTDIRNLGAILDVPEAAEALAADMQADLDAAAALTADQPRVRVWQYAGEQVPYPVGGTGIPNAIMWLAGAENVFEDVMEVYGEVSWEQVIARDPEVIWLQTSAGPGFIEAEDALRAATDANEGLAAVTGVANQAYVVVPYTTAGTLSVHNAEAVLEFATALAEVTGG